MRLIPCEHCARHVRDDESVCPFCAHPRVARSRRTATLVRTAIAASALLTVACGGAGEPAGGEGREGSVGDEAEAGAETESESETVESETVESETVEPETVETVETETVEAEPVEPESESAEVEPEGEVENEPRRRVRGPDGPGAIAAYGGPSTERLGPRIDDRE